MTDVAPAETPPTEEAPADEVEDILLALSPAEAISKARAALGEITYRDNGGHVDVTLALVQGLLAAAEAKL